jgi:hypothetical protein
MAKTNTLPVTQTIQNWAQTIVNATSFTAANPGTAPTNTILLGTAGADGSVVKAILIASSDTASASVQFWLSTDGGTTKYLLTTVVVAALSGFATLTNIDVLANTIMAGLPIDSAGRPVLELAASTKIYICVITAAVTASKNVYVTAQVEDY